MSMWKSHVISLHQRKCPCLEHVTVRLLWYETAVITYPAIWGFLVSSTENRLQGVRAGSWMEHKLNMMKRSLHVVRWLLCYLTTVTVNTVCLTLTAIVHSTSRGHQATLQGGSSYHRHFTGDKIGYRNAKGPW